MAYDNSTSTDFRVGEADILFASFTGVAPATATITAGSTFTLYDQNQITVPGFAGIPVTGYDSGANILTGRVWYHLDTAGLAPAIYYAVFSYSITGNDTLVRSNRPDIQIRILPIVEIIATYDLTTLRGQIRLWARDKDMVNPVNSDAEIDSCLHATGYTGAGTDTFDPSSISRVFLGAAFAFDLVSGDAAKVAIIEKIGAISDNTNVTYVALKDMADTLRTRASQNALPVSGVQSVIYINGVATIGYPDPFYNSPWLPVVADGTGHTTPTSPLNSW